MEKYLSRVDTDIHKLTAEQNQDDVTEPQNFQRKTLGIVLPGIQREIHSFTISETSSRGVKIYKNKYNKNSRNALRPTWFNFTKYPTD